MNDNQDVNNIIMDMLLRITILEKLLLDKGILSKEELEKVTLEVTEKVSNILLEKNK